MMQFDEVRTSCSELSKVTVNLSAMTCSLVPKFVFT